MFGQQEADPYKTVRAAARDRSGDPASLNEGGQVSAGAAFRDAGLSPVFALEPRDALALVNGTAASAAIAVLALIDAWNCLQHADLALACKNLVNVIAAAGG